MAKVATTFRLDEGVLAALAALVRDGKGRSRTAVLEELVRFEGKRLARKELERKLEKEIAEAWADPEYRADRLRIEEEFWPLQVEAWLRRDPEPFPDSAGP